MFIRTESGRLEVANDPDLQRIARINNHQHARLTPVRRIELVCSWTVDALSTSEGADLFAVTPATLRKWFGRFLAGGDAALADASSRPCRSP